MGIKIRVVDASSEGEINAAFATLGNDRPDALIVAADILLDQPEIGRARVWVNFVI